MCSCTPEPRTPCLRGRVRFDPQPRFAQCNTILSDLQTSRHRVAHLSLRSVQIARRLESHPQFGRVVYPGLESMPGYRYPPEQGSSSTETTRRSFRQTGSRILSVLRSRTASRPRGQCLTDGIWRAGAVLVSTALARSILLTIAESLDAKVGPQRRHEVSTHPDKPIFGD